MGEHRLQRIHIQCSVPKVIGMYQERSRKNDWREKEERYDLEFIES